MWFSSGGRGRQRCRRCGAEDAFLFRLLIQRWVVEDAEQRLSFQHRASEKQRRAENRGRYPGQWDGRLKNPWLPKAAGTVRPHYGKGRLKIAWTNSVPLDREHIHIIYGLKSASFVDKILPKKFPPRRGNRQIAPRPKTKILPKSKAAGSPQNFMERKDRTERLS